MKETVVVLGASENPERYSYQAFQLLKKYGHQPIPVNPRLESLEGEKVYAKLGDVKQKVDTLTVYVSPEKSSALDKEILQLNPKRIIFNPGAENPELEKVCEAAGIDVERACTLVLLRTNQFENEKKM